ncbi:MAG: COX15/CtaA family protein [Bacteroidia bacterium]|nr:COX15/CtaA family protein [Bacteroidia bacterium]
MAKVQRFASTLDKIGMHKKASEIRNNQAILVPEEFNIYKAWTEYINRLFGVLAGLFSLLFLISSLQFGRSRILLYVLLSFVMLLFNAWLGSIVVATNLLPGLVTVHFLFSFLCLFFGMLALGSHKPFRFQSTTLKPLWVLLFILVLVEVILGTFARETVEGLGNLDSNVQNGMLPYQSMGLKFTLHRLLPGLVWILSLLGIYLSRRAADRMASKAFAILSLLCLFQIALGAVNIVYVLPAWSQVIHIVLGSFLPLYLFYIHISKPSSINTSQV